MEGMAVIKELLATAVEAGESPEAGRRCRGVRALRCSASTEEEEAGQNLGCAQCTARGVATSVPTTPSLFPISAHVVLRLVRSAEASQQEEAASEVHSFLEEVPQHQEGPGIQGEEGPTSSQQAKEGTG